MSCPCLNSNPYELAFFVLFYLLKIGEAEFTYACFALIVSAQ